MRANETKPKEYVGRTGTFVPHGLNNAVNATVKSAVTDPEGIFLRVEVTSDRYAYAWPWIKRGEEYWVYVDAFQFGDDRP